MLQKENYSSQVLLHERAIEILELRTRAIKRLNEAQADLNRFNGYTRWQKDADFYNIEHYTWKVKVKERSVSFLTGLYARHSAKICGTLPAQTVSARPTTATPVEVPELQAANSFGSGFGDFDESVTDSRKKWQIAINGAFILPSIEFQREPISNQPNCIIDEYHNPRSDSAGYQ